jgi:hypothetical protein
MVILYWKLIIQIITWIWNLYTLLEFSIHFCQVWLFLKIYLEVCRFQTRIRQLTYSSYLCAISLYRYNSNIRFSMKSSNSKTTVCYCAVTAIYSDMVKYCMYDVLKIIQRGTKRFYPTVNKNIIFQNLFGKQ